MEKIIQFTVPSVEEEGVCFVTVDDGRIFQVSLPERVAAGQILVATVDNDNMMLEYYHSEGDVGTAYGRAVPKLVIGSVVTEVNGNGEPIGAATTIGEQPVDTDPTTIERIRNEVLSSSMAVRVIAATKQVLERASELDAEYKVSENVTNAVASAVEKAEELDRDYKISEKAVAAGSAAVGKLYAAMEKVDDVLFSGNPVLHVAEEEKKE